MELICTEELQIKLKSLINIEEITNSTPEKLRDIYIELKPLINFPAGKIANKYGVNKRSFLKWLKDEKPSHALSYHLTRDIFMSIYLRGCYPEYIVKPPPPKTYTMNEALHILDMKVNSPDYSIAKVFIVDLDNLQFCKTPQIDEFVVAVGNDCMLNKKCDHNILRVLSQTNKSNAADFTICILATIVSERYPWLKLSVVTDDRFAIELCTQIPCTQIKQDSVRID